MAKNPRNIVDPDTGFSPAQQEKRWNELFEKKQEETKLKPKRKVGIRQPKSANSIKPQAIELLRLGKSVKEVSIELGVTYANINYYRKFV